MLIQFLILIPLSVITYQDFNERAVYWWLFPLTGFLQGFIFFKQTVPEYFSANILQNFCVVLGIIGILYLYAKFKLKLSLFKDAFGIGDALFFIAFAFSFPTQVFIILLSFSLIFSCIASLLFFKNKKNIPLAGLMGIFLSLTYICSWLFNTINLYDL